MTPSLAVAGIAALIAVAVHPAAAADAGVPATEVMTVYRFNGPLELPYYEVAEALRDGPRIPAGHLVQGTAVIPCLVLREGKPVTDASGTPWVGFDVVVDPPTATPESGRTFSDALATRRQLRVRNHHCPPGGPRPVIDVRTLHHLERPPFFEPPRPTAPHGQAEGAAGLLDSIVRAFHESSHCAEVNATLLRRRERLLTAWDRFSRAHAGRWPEDALHRARQLDVVMRTALFEGHLERGCTAYGACERLIIALSIRNRARGGCRRGQGCRYPGDLEGVATAVSQYNIWDEYLTQVSGLTSCFLRSDLAAADTTTAARLRRMYAQSVQGVESILFGPEADLAMHFPEASPGDLLTLRHYYHPPAMGACFPDRPDVEYVSGAVARRGDDFVLVANQRVQVDAPTPGGYRFRIVRVRDTADRDELEIQDLYPGFVVDGRKIAGARPTGCRPHGLAASCTPGPVGRYRKIPSWFETGKPLRTLCRVEERGPSCALPSSAARTVAVGGPCDREMQPVAGVP